MELKKKLAFTLIRMLNTLDEAQKAQLHFESLFQKGKGSDGMPVYELPGDVPIPLLEIIIANVLAQSRTQAKRLFRERAIELDGKVIENELAEILPSSGMIIKVGKHKFIKLKAQS